MFRFFKSTQYALEGVIYAVRTERNVQIWLGVLIANLLVAYLLGVSKMEFLLILLSTGAIGISEHLNTSIEMLSDRVTMEKEDIIKRVKDTAAGATFVASSMAFIISMAIYIPKILELLEINL